MTNNSDILGFYKRATGSFVRWNSNDPATLRQITSCKHDVQYMASDTITVEVDSVAKINDIEVGDYMRHGGATFRLNQSPAISKTGERKLRYTFVFESVKYELINAMFILPANEVVTDDFTGTMFELLKLIVSNACRVFGTGTWQLPLNGTAWAGTATLPTEAKTVSYDNQNCLYVLQNICEEWSKESNTYEYNITEDPGTGVKTIDIVVYEKNTDYIGIGTNRDPFQYGAGKGLYEIERTASNSDSIVTRLFAFGSSDNLPTRYFATRLGLAKARGTGTVGDKALSYVETYTQNGQTITPINTYGLREGVANFDDIKPHATYHARQVSGITTSQFYVYIATGTTEPAAFDLNAKWKHYNADSGADYTEYLKYRNLADNTNVLQSYETNVADTYKYISTGETPSITFNSGDMAGQTYKIKAATTGVEYNHSLLRITLLTNDEENAFDPSTGTTQPHYYTPNSQLQPATGDAFVFTGINLPWSFVAQAEQELKTLADEKFEEVSQPKAAYKIKIANDFILETYGIHNADIITTGKYLRITDADIGLTDKKIRITQYSRDLIKGYEYDITVSDFAPKPRTSLLQAYRGQQASTATPTAGTTIGGTPSLTEGVTLDMEFTASNNASKLDFYAIDTGMNVGTLQDTGKGMRWLIANGSAQLTQDTAYYIYISLNKGVPSTGSVYVRPWQQAGTIQGELAEKNNTYLVLAGKISARAYSATTATQPYRTVEMYIGRALNQARQFIGTQIGDADGNVAIKLGTGLAAVDLKNPTTGSAFRFKAAGELKMIRAEVGNDPDDEDATSPIGCWRGDFAEGTTYNNGDLVRLSIPGDPNNYATYRCLIDGTTTEPTTEDPGWAAMTPTTPSGGGTTDYSQLSNQPTYADGTTSGTFVGQTDFKTINQQSIFGTGDIAVSGGGGLALTIAGHTLIAVAISPATATISNHTITLTT